MTTRRHGGSANYTITAEAKDNVGVAYVDFYVDLFFRTRVEVPVSGTSDYVTALKIQQAGLHVVEARAFDTSGNTSSATVTVKR